MTKVMEPVDEKEKKESADVSKRSEKSGELTRREPSFAAEWSPLAFVRRFGEEMDRLFRDFGIGGLTPGWDEFGRAAWSPQIEIFERDGKLTVRADLPGVKKEDLKVEVKEGMLTIQGERRKEFKEDREGYYRSERSYGKFFRSIPLPEGVKPDDVKASFKDAMLEVNMPAPKTKKGEGKRIEIR